MTDERSFNERIIAEFRAGEGEVGGPFEGRSLLLLHHVGALSGTARVNPVEYLAVGDSYAIFGSNDGSEHNPRWYYNVLANPNLTIEVGTSTIAVAAREVSGPERMQIWARQKELRPIFAEYEEGTSRQIPVLVLDPAV